MSMDMEIPWTIFCLIAFPISLTLYHTCADQVYIECNGNFFMSGHAVLEEIRMIYFHPTSDPHLIPSTSIL